MTIPYQQNGDFLSAWVEIIVRPPKLRSHPDEFRGRALVDTGAEMTHLPEMLMYALDLYSEGTAHVVGYGGSGLCKVYAVSLEIIKPNGNIYHPIVQIYASDRDKLALGMNILKLHSSMFHGPNLSLSMTP